MVLDLSACGDLCHSATDMTEPTWCGDNSVMACVSIVIEQGVYFLTLFKRMNGNIIDSCVIVRYITMTDGFTTATGHGYFSWLHWFQRSSGSL